MCWDGGGVVLGVPFISLISTPLGAELEDEEGSVSHFYFGKFILILFSEWH